MRIFTDNDRLALAAAMQTFYGSMDGSTVRINTSLEHVNKALEAGLSVDELVNRNNYARVCDIIEKPNMGAYVDALIERSIVVRPLKKEDDWSDPDGFILYAEIFHDFYQKINGTGGTYTTSTAKANLMKAINRNSLQAILSEKLIREVMEKTNKGDKLTCFNYIDQLLRDAEAYDIDNSPSEEQQARRELEEQNNFKTVEKPDRNADTGEAEETVRESDGDPSVNTESADPEYDESLYPENDNYEMQMQEEEEQVNQGANVTFIAALNPKQFKQNHVHDAVMTLKLHEILELARYVTCQGTAEPESMMLEEFINALASGNIAKHNESIDARTVHGYLNGELLPHFMECIAMQGMKISEETASKIDFLSDSWDMRDGKTRKLQKVMDLIYHNAMDDPELQDVIEDLKQFYQEN